MFIPHVSLGMNMQNNDFYIPYLVKIKPDIKDVAICVWSQNIQNFLIFLHKCFGYNLDDFFDTVDQYFM